MSLSSVLVDRARYLRVSRDAPKVDGSTRRLEETGEWFRARLTVAGGQEQPGSGGPGARSRRAQRTTLMMKPLDDGSCPLRATDRVEVSSTQYGSSLWLVVGDPEPWRKKRKVIGYEAQLDRVEQG